jgi:hypothetical protein
MLAQLDPNLVVALVLAAFFLLDALVLILWACSLGKKREPAPPKPKREPAKKSSSVIGGVIIMVFVLVWSAVTLTFDIQLVRNAVNQFQTADYRAVEGKW